MGHGRVRGDLGGGGVRDLKITPMDMGQIRANIVAEQAQHADVLAAFHCVFYESPHTHTFTNWCGVPILKNPLDLWIFQELLWDLQPTLIVETGTAYGGSALFLANMLDRRGGLGRVVSIDIEPHEKLPRHQRVLYLTGSSTDPTIVAQIRAIAAGHDRVMVILDSDHSRDHVLAELDCYADLVTPGQFLVVEDTNIDGHPVQRDWMGGPGPSFAVAEWLPQHPEFAADVLAERMMMTFYPGGWLRRGVR